MSMPTTIRMPAAKKAAPKQVIQQIRESKPLQAMRIIIDKALAGLSARIGATVNELAGSSESPAAVRKIIQDHQRDFAAVYALTQQLRATIKILGKDSKEAWGEARTISAVLLDQYVALNSTLQGTFVKVWAEISQSGLLPEMSFDFIVRRMYDELDKPFKQAMAFRNAIKKLEQKS
jgi:hypothetical protein